MKFLISAPLRDAVRISPFTQQRLAARVGIAPSLFSEILYGRFVGARVAARLQKLARLFNLPDDAATVPVESLRRLQPFYPPDWQCCERPQLRIKLLEDCRACWVCSTCHAGTRAYPHPPQPSASK